MNPTRPINQGLLPTDLPLGLPQKSANIDSISDEPKIMGQAKRILDYGLKIFKQMPELIKPGEEFITPGQKTRIFAKGDQIGDYIYQDNKERGIEPGFEALKAWREKDENQLNDPAGKLHRQANEFIQDVLFSLESRLNYDVESDHSPEDIKRFNGLAREAAEIIRNELGTTQPNLHQNTLPEMIDQLRDTPALRPLVKEYLMNKRVWRAEDEARLRNSDHPFHTMLKNYIREQLEMKGLEKNRLIMFKDLVLKKHPEIDPNDQEAIVNKVVELFVNSDQPFTYLLDNIQSHILREENNIKFQKIHYIKLDYNDPNKAGLVKIPKDRAQGGIFFVKIYHRNSTAGTIKEKNLSAVTEVLSNDIFQALGIASQKLKIIDAQYNDGSHKFLLDGTHASGPKDEPFSTFLGKIRSGRLKGNCVIDPITKEEIPVDEKDLAVTKITALLMGDFDKIGFKGANIGYVIKMEDGKKIAKLMNIDPGKSLEMIEDLSPSKENSSTIGYFIKKLLYPLKFYLVGKTNRMTQHNIHNDFSFDQPNTTIPDIISRGYKNFTIFDDTTLVEKMEGVKRIKQEWEKVEDIFNEYEKVLKVKSTNPDGSVCPELDFVDEIIKMRALLEARKDYILEVFADRINLTNPELTVLDHLEKLTSPTRDRFRSKLKTFKLKHLQVNPKQRKEWKLQEIRDAQGVVTEALTCNVSNKKEAKKTIKQINKHADRVSRSTQPHPVTLPPIHLIPQDDGHYQIQIRVNRENFAPVAFYFENEQEIAATKKQKLLTI